MHLSVAELPATSHHLQLKQPDSCVALIVCNSYSATRTNVCVYQNSAAPFCYDGIPHKGGCGSNYSSSLCSLDAFHSAMRAWRAALSISRFAFSSATSSFIRARNLNRRETAHSKATNIFVFLLLCVTVSHRTRHIHRRLAARWPSLACPTLHYWPTQRRTRKGGRNCLRAAGSRRVGCVVL